MLSPWATLNRSPHNPSSIASLVIVIIPPLIPPLIVGIAHPITKALDLITKSLSTTNLLANPASNVLRRLLNIIYGIVVLPLNTVTEAIEAFLDVLGDLLCLANSAASPLRSVLREVGGGVLETRFVFVPVFLCDYLLALCVLKEDRRINQDILISSPSCMSKAPAPKPSAAPPIPHAAALPWPFSFFSSCSPPYWPCCCCCCWYPSCAPP